MSDEIIMRFAAIAKRAEQMDELRAAIGTFLVNFAMFESMALTAALQSVSNDHTLVEHLPELMDLYNRLKLLKQLGVAHNLPLELQKDIARMRKVANALLECRNDIAHGAATLTGPFLTDPNADLTPGVRRRRSERVMPATELDSEQTDRLFQRWTHSLPTILRWSEIATQLDNATRQLAQKLALQRRGESWSHLVVPIVEMPVRDPPKENL